MLRKKQQQRVRKSAVREDTVPMTKYYRSGNEGGASASPFKPKKKKRARRKLFIKAFDFIVVIALFVVIGYSLVVSSDPNVKTTYTGYHSQAEYKKAISSYLGSIKNKNKFTFDEKGLIKSIRDQYPEVSDVTIELPLLHQTPTFRLSIAQPSFILNSGGRLFVVGDSGRAVASANGFNNLADLVVVNDETGFTPGLGRQVLSKSGVKFLNDIVAQSIDAGVPLSNMTLPAKAEELHLRTKDRSYFVKFFLGGDPDQQIGQFLATRHKFDSDGTAPNEYLDVRVPGKIYYK